MLNLVEDLSKEQEEYFNINSLPVLVQLLKMLKPTKCESN